MIPSGSIEPDALSALAGGLVFLATLWLAFATFKLAQSSVKQSEAGGAAG